MDIAEHNTSQHGSTVKPGSKSVIVNGVPNKVAAGTPANLVCPAEIASGESRITWEKLDGELSQRTSQYRGILIINNVKQEDEGTYVCTIFQGQTPLAKINVLLNVTDYIPKFTRDGYMELPALPREAAQQLDIQISFKPELEDGIMFHAPAPGSDGDNENFVAVGLRDKKIVYRFNLGAESAEIISSKDVSMGEWHSLVVKRKGKEGTLIVNEEDVNSGVAEGERSQLKIGESVFLGGVRDYSTIGYNTVGFEDGFKGIISEYIVNGESINLGESRTASAGVDEAKVCRERPCLNRGVCVPAHEPQGYKCDCLPGWLGFNCERAGCIPDVTCGKGTCIPDDITGFYCLCPLNTTGTSCGVPLSLTGSPYFDGKKSFLAIKRPNLEETSKIRLRIRPESLDDSVLFYSSAASDGTGDYIGLAIQDGSLLFSYNTGSGAAEIKSDIPLEKDQWFEISVSRTGKEGMLTVGRGRHESSGESPGDTTDLNLATNLFFGGVMHGMVMPESFNFERSFKGCITSPVSINGSNVDLVVSALDGANISPCPVLDACASNPCREDATCVSLDDGTYQCECPDEAGCEKPIDLCKDQPADQCGEHGDCVTVNKTHTRCECEVGWDGELCQIAKPVQNQGYFTGDSWVEFGANLMTHSSSEQEEIIELSFTTTADEGVILWQGMKQDQVATTDKDYLTLGLTPDGQLEFSYELGGGPSELVTTHKVNDGNKHTVKLIRKGKNGQLIVDDMEPVTGSSEGILELLNSDGSYFIGGVPDLEDSTFGKHRKNFVGCIGEIRFNTKPINFQEQRIGGQNVIPCPVDLRKKMRFVRRRRYHILGS